MNNFKQFKLSFYKNSFNLINNNDIIIPKTGIVVIFGKSGSGKSTLFNALLNKKIRKKIINLGFTPAVFKTEESIPNNYLVSDLLKTANRDILNSDIIDLLDIRNLLDKKTEVLSGGEKSRVRLAMILGNNAEILLLDEPHVMVDKNKVEQEVEAIKVTSKNKLIFVVTHYPELYDTPYRIKLEGGTITSESKELDYSNSIQKEVDSKKSKGQIGKRFKKESLFQTISGFLSLSIGLSLFVLTSTISTFSSLKNLKPNFDTFGEGYNARTVSVNSLTDTLTYSEKEEFFNYADPNNFEKYYSYELIDKGYSPEPEFLLEAKLGEKVTTINYRSPIDNFFKVANNINIIQSFGKISDLEENEIVLVTQKEYFEFNKFSGVFTSLTGYSGTEYDALETINWSTQTLSATYKYKNFGSIQTTIDFIVSGFIFTENYEGYYSDNEKWSNEIVINEFFSPSEIVDQKPSGSINETYILKTLFARYIGSSEEVDSSIASAINDSGYDLTYYVNINDEIIVDINSRNKVFTKQKMSEVFNTLSPNLTINNYTPRSLNYNPLVEWQEAESLGFVGIPPLSYTNADNYQTLGYKEIFSVSNFSWQDNYFVVSKELAIRYYQQSENTLSYDDNDLSGLVGKTFNFGFFSLKLGAIIEDAAYPELVFALTSFNHLLSIEQYFFTQSYTILVNDYTDINTVMNYYATENSNRGTAFYDFDIVRVQSAVDKYDSYAALIAKSTTSSIIVSSVVLVMVSIIYGFVLRTVRKNDNFFANIMPKESKIKIALLRSILPLLLVFLSFLVSPLIYSAIQDTFATTFTNFTINNSLVGINLNKTFFINYLPISNAVMISVVLVFSIINSLSSLIRVNRHERSIY